jgi:hypothetical protein
MAPEARDSLYACITDLIDNDYRGHVTKRYMTELVLAHRVA